jgi:hypothetical protein
MADAIETAVATTAKADVKSLENRVTAAESRLKDLEAEAAGWVRGHVVYFVGAVCLVLGAVAGHVFR